MSKSYLYLSLIALTLLGGIIYESDIRNSLVSSASNPVYSVRDLEVKHILPDPIKHPGKINAKQIDFCQIKTSTVRPPSSYTSKLKAEQLMDEGYTMKNPSLYEEDHVVSLTLNGDPKAPENLWPQPYNVTLNGQPMGARQKDKLELYLHNQICAGKMTYTEAQMMMTTNWVQYYKKYSLDKQTFGAGDNSAIPED